MINACTDQGQSGGPARLAVVLGAGGLRGIAHVGVLETLVEMGVRPDVVIGTSSGAIVGACYAVLGWEPASMVQAALGMGPLASLSLSLRRRPLRGLAPLLQKRPNWLTRVLDALSERDFETLHHGVRRFGVTCYDLVSRSEKFFYTGQLDPRPSLDKAVLASAALPILCPGQSVAVDGTRMWLIDGGLSRTLPVDLALEPPISAQQALAIDLGVATGWNERSLDHQDRLGRRYGDRLMLIKPDVASYGTVLIRRADPGRIIAAGRRAVGSEVARWVGCAHV